MRYPPYPSYKPSGVEWLGEVPEHWQGKRLKHVGTIRYGLGEPPEYTDDGVPFIRATDIKQGTIDLDSVRRVSPADVPWSRRPQLAEGEVLVVRSGAYTGDSALVTPQVAGSVAGYDMVLTVTKAVPGFVAWVLLSKYMLESQIHLVRLRAAQPHLNAEELGGFLIIVPPVLEQHLIAHFLNTRTEKLDTLMAKKRALIEKLKEKRSALISRTVTWGLPPEAARAAGLEPYPKLKPSGVEWIGEVPEHWIVTQLKRAVMFKRGHDLPADERQEGIVPVISSAGVFFRHDRAIAKGPGIVTGRYGTIGQFQLVEEDYWPLNTTLYSIDLHDNGVRFLRYMLIHLSPLVLVHAVKSAVPGVDRNDLHPTETAIPPVEEQRAIADFLDCETAKIDHMVAKVEAAIERLQEYRSALITAAVTGKIDVRTAAA